MWLRPLEGRLSAAAIPPETSGRGHRRSCCSWNSWTLCLVLGSSHGLRGHRLASDCQATGLCPQCLEHLYCPPTPMFRASPSRMWLVTPIVHSVMARTEWDSVCNSFSTVARTLPGTPHLTSSARLTLSHPLGWNMLAHAPGPRVPSHQNSTSPWRDSHPWEAFPILALHRMGGRRQEFMSSRLKNISIVLEA